MPKCKYPWYFKENDILKIWSYGIKGRSVVIELIDSLVNFELPALKNKGTNVYYTANKKSDIKDHGTAMASLINAKFLTSQNCLNKEEIPCGIATLSFIRSYDSAITYDDVSYIYKTTRETPNQAIPIGRVGLLYREEYIERDQKIVLINLSGGQIIPDDTELRGDWNKLIKNVCKQNSMPGDKGAIIIASFGNNGTYITDTNVVTDGIIPATMQPKKCSNNPIVSVSGAAKYNKELQIDPDVYKSGNGGNYGEKFAHILAPGDEIPMLLFDGQVLVSHGSSPAAAIATASLAMMISCMPKANVSELRNALLEHSDHYKDLQTKVQNGTVLNLLGIIKNFCAIQEQEIDDL